jgi:hypothetical protein
MAVCLAAKILKRAMHKLHRRHGGDREVRDCKRRGAAGRLQRVDWRGYESCSARAATGLGERCGGGRAEWRWARGVAAGIGLAAKPPFYTIYINVFWSMSIHYRVCVLVAIDWNAAVMSDI